MSKTTRPRPALSLLQVLFLNALPLAALDFQGLLAGCKEVSPPLMIDLTEDEPSLSAESLSFEEFRAYLGEPGLRLSPLRPDLRKLDDWARNFNGTEGYGPNSFGRASPYQGFSLNGHPILAFYARYLRWEDAVDDSEPSIETFLFSLSPGGRLIDGMTPRPRISLDLDAWVQEVKKSRAALLDPLIHQGRFLYASLAIDADKRIIIIERYGFGDLVGEVATRTIALSKEGLFAEAAPRRRYGLARVFAEAGGGAGELALFETEAAGKAGPGFVRWNDRKEAKTSPLEAELPTALVPGASRSLLSLRGTKLGLELSTDGKRLTLTDPAGTSHSLALAFGPGDRGEETAIFGTEGLGDHNAPESRAWRYLFIPTPLLPLEGSGQVLFAAHSFAIGPTYGAYEAKELRGDPAADTIAIGTLAGASSIYAGGRERSLAPGSLQAFGYTTVIGFFAEKVDIVGRSSKIELPPGSLYDDLHGEGMYQVAVPAAETPMLIGKIPFRIPAGSRVEFNSIYNVEKISFSEPVSLRIGSAKLSISLATFNGETGNLEMAHPLGAEKGGTGSDLAFYEDGQVRSGFIQGSEIKGPFFKNGMPRAGDLLVPATFESGGSTVSLLRGDGVTLREDGSLEACLPRSLLTLSRGGRSVVRALPALSFKADGSLAADRIPGELKASPGTITISPLFALCVDSRVRVRAQPNLQGSTQGYLDKGDRLVVLEKSAKTMKLDEATDYWYRVRRLSDGLEGWSYGQYLKVGE